MLQPASARSSDESMMAGVMSAAELAPSPRMMRQAHGPGHHPSQSEPLPQPKFVKALLGATQQQQEAEGGYSYALDAFGNPIALAQRVRPTHAAALSLPAPMDMAAANAAVASSLHGSALGGAISTTAADGLGRKHNRHGRHGTEEERRERRAKRKQEKQQKQLQQQQEQAAADGGQVQQQLAGSLSASVASVDDATVTALAAGMVPPPETALVTPRPSQAALPPQAITSITLIGPGSTATRTSAAAAPAASDVPHNTTATAAEPPPPAAAAAATTTMAAKPHRRSHKKHRHHHTEGSAGSSSSSSSSTSEGLSTAGAAAAGAHGHGTDVSGSGGGLRHSRGGLSRHDLEPIPAPMKTVLAGTVILPSSPDKRGLTGNVGGGITSAGATAVKNGPTSITDAEIQAAFVLNGSGGDGGGETAPTTSNIRRESLDPQAIRLELQGAATSADGTAEVNKNGGAAHYLASAHVDATHPITNSHNVVGSIGGSGEMRITRDSIHSRSDATGSGRGDSGGNGLCGSSCSYCNCSHDTCSCGRSYEGASASGSSGSTPESSSGSGETAYADGGVVVHPHLRHMLNQQKQQHDERSQTVEQQQHELPARHQRRLTGPRRSIIHLKRDSITILHNQFPDSYDNTAAALVAEIEAADEAAAATAAASDGGFASGYRVTDGYPPPPEVEVLNTASAPASDDMMAAAISSPAQHLLEQRADERYRPFPSPSSFGPALSPDGRDTIHGRATGDFGRRRPQSASGASRASGGRFRLAGTAALGAARVSRRLSLQGKHSPAFDPTKRLSALTSCLNYKATGGGLTSDCDGPIIWLAGNVALPRPDQGPITERLATAAASSLSAAGATSASSEEDDELVRRIIASVRPSPAYLAYLRSLRSLSLSDGRQLLDLLEVDLDKAVPEVSRGGAAGARRFHGPYVSSSARGREVETDFVPPLTSSATASAPTPQQAHSKLRYLHLVISGPAYGIQFAASKTSVSPYGCLYIGKRPTVVQAVARASPFRQLIRPGDQLVAAGGIDVTPLGPLEAVRILRYIGSHATSARSYLLTLLVSRASATRAKLASALESQHAARAGIVAMMGGSKADAGREWGSCLIRGCVLSLFASEGHEHSWARSSSYASTLVAGTSTTSAGGSRPFPASSLGATRQGTFGGGPQPVSSHPLFSAFLGVKLS